MRQAYPLIWCCSPDIQAKLLGRLTDLDALPDQEWHEWQPSEQKVVPLDIQEIEAGLEYYDKIMRRSPSRSRG